MLVNPALAVACPVLGPPPPRWGLFRWVTVPVPGPGGAVAAGCCHMVSGDDLMRRPGRNQRRARGWRLRRFSCLPIFPVRPPGTLAGGGTTWPLSDLPGPDGPAVPGAATSYDQLSMTRSMTVISAEPNPHRRPPSAVPRLVCTGGPCPGVEAVSMDRPWQRCNGRGISGQMVSCGKRRSKRPQANEPRQMVVLEQQGEQAVFLWAEARDHIIDGPPGIRPAAILICPAR